MHGFFLDTGVWLASLDKRDPLHPRAKALIESHPRHPLIATDAVFFETVTLMRRELGPDRAVEFGREFLRGEIGILIRTEPEDWIEALRIIETYREQKISMADGLSMSVIRRLDIPKVASFDKHFKIVMPEREILGLL